MSQPLPVNDFKWTAEREIVSFYVTTIPDDAETSYILEVDLEYPEKMVITHDMLFPYQQELKKELGYKPAKVGA